jgi:hypothetical protein
MIGFQPYLICLSNNKKFKRKALYKRRFVKKL